MNNKHEMVLSLLVAAGQVEQSQVDKWMAYAEENFVKPLPEVRLKNGCGKLYYELRQRRMKWREIQERFNLCNNSAPFNTAKHYAVKNNLPWPI